MITHTTAHVNGRTNSLGVSRFTFSEELMFKSFKSPGMNCLAVFSALICWAKCEPSPLEFCPVCLLQTAANRCHCMH